jgi:SAM-dependent methyltransferase
MPENLRPTATFYDRAAAQYDSQVDGVTDNVRLRDVFRKRVSVIAGSGAKILDFGCGTGTDAAWYASHGHSVIAYDISAGMLDVLRNSCAGAIKAGQILPVAGELPDLLAVLDRIGPVAAIAADLAVLNHLRDLRELFQALAPRVTSNGVVLASILNPFYWHSIASGWWWKGMPRSLWTGCITMKGAVTTHRHYLRHIRRMAEPRFALVEHKSSVAALAEPPQANSSWGDVLSSNFLIITLRRTE